MTIDVQPLKDVCDRDWQDETPQQVIIIAANALHWRDVEISKLNGERQRLREALRWALGLVWEEYCVSPTEVADSISAEYKKAETLLGASPDLS